MAKHGTMTLDIGGAYLRWVDSGQLLPGTRIGESTKDRMRSTWIYAPHGRKT